jgi:hypothetical protein
MAQPQPQMQPQERVAAMGAFLGVSPNVVLEDGE